MYIAKASLQKSRPPSRRPPQLCARSSTTIVSNTERASCESIKARAPATVEYRNRLVRIGRPRAQGRRPPRDVGTGTRAFNAPAAFSPNPSVTGSVIGNKHPSCHSFCSLPHQTNQNMAGHREWVGTSNQETPRDAKGQHSGQRGVTRHQTLESACFLPGEGSGDERQHLNHSGVAVTATYKHATDKPIHDGAQERNSGARVIIIRVQDKTARGHAGTEASSGSAHHTSIDPYSVAYTCTLDLSLEL